MKQLILTVGLPRSGKSTWAMGSRYPVVNPDSIRLALHGQAFLREAEPMVWTMARYMVESLFLAGHDIVVLDATNVLYKRRREWASKKWRTRYMLFRTSKEECINRVVPGKNEYLIPVIERMWKQMVPLNQEEQKDEWDEWCDDSSCN